MIKPEIIARLRELLEKATPGEWEACEEAIGAINGPDCLVALIAMHQGSVNETDAALIAESRNALPGLLDEIERLRGLLSRVAGPKMQPYMGGSAYICRQCDRAESSFAVNDWYEANDPQRTHMKERPDTGIDHEADCLYVLARAALRGEP